MPSLTDIAYRAYDVAVGHLDYTPDSTSTGQADDWRSHAREMLADPAARYRDDCDGAAITAAEWAIAQGVAPNLVRIVMVDTQDRGDPNVIDHMVCTIGRQGDDPLVIDNCQRGPVPASRLNYTWGAGMRASEPGIWRRTNVTA